MADETGSQRENEPGAPSTGPASAAEKGANAPESTGTPGPPPPDGITSDGRSALVFELKREQTTDTLDPPLEPNEEVWCATDTSEWSIFVGIDKPAGEPLRGRDAELQAWREAARGCRALVVAGFDPQYTMWVAEQLGRDGGWEDVRRGGQPHVLQVGSFDKIFRLLRSGKSRCVVLDFWAPVGHTAFARGIAALAEAADNSDKKACQVVVWTHHALLLQAETVGWPENVLSIPIDSRPPTDGEPTNRPDEPEFFRRLFGSGLKTVEEVLAAEKRVIEQTLVRLLVLFGTMSTSDVDELMAAALDSKELVLGAAGKDEAKYVPARQLWTQGKDFFLREAGLARSPDGASIAIGFASIAAADAAATVAWNDPEAMIELFREVSSLMLLFDVESDRTRRFLFERYVNAATGLAHHCPRLFGGRWVGLVESQYVQWLAVTGIEAPPEAEARLLPVLKALVARGDHKRRRLKLARHFATRVGFLCRYLMAESAGIVESFLDDLMAAKLPEIAWMLLQEITGQLQGRYFHWVKRLLNESREFASALPDILATQAAHSADAALDIVCELDGWRREPNESPRNATESIAIEFPFRFLAELYRRHESDGTLAIDLSTFMKRTIVRAGTEGRSVADYVVDCLLRDAKQRHKADTGDVSRLAVALFQMVLTTSLAARTEVAATAARVMRGMPPSTRRAVVKTLGAIQEQFLEHKRVLRFNAEDEPTRSFLNERAAVCSMVIQL